MIQNQILNPDTMIITEMTKSVTELFAHMFGNYYPREQKIGQMKEVLETCIVQSAGIISSGIDIPYHDLRHTFDVAMSMQEILYGKSTVESVSPEDWFNCMIAAVNHDIGYIPGLFIDDEINDNMTGAQLSATHVQRSMRYVKERFQNSNIINGDEIAEYIEYTVVPVSPVLNDNGSYGGLLRAADYIGQFANINIRKKNNALLYEFQETGLAEKLGYNNLGDVIKGFPAFFDNAIEPILHPAIEYLQRTINGTMIVNTMYGVIKQCEIYKNKNEQ